MPQGLAYRRQPINVSSIPFNCPSRVIKRRLYRNRNVNIKSTPQTVQDQNVRIHKTQSIQRRDYYLVIKRNEALTYSQTQVNLRNLCPGKGARHEGHVLYDRVYSLSRLGEFTETESRLEVSTGAGGWADRELLPRATKHLFGVRKKCWEQSVVMVVQCYKYNQRHQIGHLKVVQMEKIFYHNKI